MIKQHSDSKIVDAFKDAQNRLVRYFSNGGWEIYDGVEVSQDNILTIHDIVISVALNSRVNRNSIWYLWQQKYLIEEALSRVPINAHLDSEQVPWNELFFLFESFCRVRYVKEAVTTKILHKKRPYLIPVYDRVVSEFFKPQMKDVRYPGNAGFLVSYLELFREIMITHKEEIYTLRDFADKKGWHVTPIRVLEVLVWIANEPNGEYRTAT
jgi:hypothetical protein